MATKKKAAKVKATKARAAPTKAPKAKSGKVKAAVAVDTEDTTFEDALDQAESDTESEGAATGGRKLAKSGTLLVVESPAKAKTIQKYLGKDYIVLASKGHVKDLPKKGGVDTEHDFEETYEVIPEKGKEEVLKVIKQAARRTKRVLLATDPDREGEAIAWHLLEEIKQTYPDKEVRRVLFNEITKKGVAEGIANPRDLDTHLYEAQRTRRVLDRIGGYPLSSLLWRKLAFGLSAGRVQTPALRIIVDRQREIDAFVPVSYWLIESQLLGNNRPAFTALLDSVDGEKMEKVSSRPATTSELDARRFVADLAGATYTVAKINKRERKAKAPAPYTTSKLQQDASTRLGMQPKRTMRIAQGLYEGVPLGEETVGLITYMRTDSVRLSPDAVTECRSFIAGKYGKHALPDEPNVFKSKKANVQDAHEAVRPTRMDLPPDSIRQFLTDERYRLYKLIWDRFVAGQMVPAVYDQTGVEIEAKVSAHTYGLRASGSVLRVPGWKAVYGAGDVALATDDEPADASGDDESERTLPVLAEGERLKLEGAGVQSHAKQTEPPPYFNEASLVKKLEEEGIGRPSTYAEIISKVQARDYVVKVNNKLMPSDLGRLVIEKLVADKFDLADLGFTRKLEEDLDAIAENRGNRLAILRPFHERLQAKIAASMEDKGKWWPEPELLEEKCPECGKDLMKRWGRNGAFVGCVGYPDCKHTRNLTADGQLDDDKQPVMTDFKCDLCGSAMMKRWGRNGFFLGCSTFPKCKGTRNLPLGIDCPKCGGEVIEIRARKGGRPFYGCSNYRSDLKCDFRIWQKPIPEACPQCQAKFLVRAGNANSPIIKCIVENCGYQRVGEEVGEDGVELAPTGTEGEN